MRGTDALPGVLLKEFLLHDLVLQFWVWGQECKPPKPYPRPDTPNHLKLTSEPQST